MTPNLDLVQLIGAELVATLFGQFTKREKNGEEKSIPDTRWVYRHADRHGFLHSAARRRKGTRGLFFDRAEIYRILTEFRPPSDTQKPVDSHAHHPIYSEGQPQPNGGEP